MADNAAIEKSRAAESVARLRSMAIGTQVEVRRADGQVVRGTLVPAHDFSDPGIVQLKLDSGYNIGVRLGPADSVRTEPPSSGPGEPRPAGAASSGTQKRPPTGWVALLTTGGTIASRVDYRTGGVRPAKGEEEILAFYPDLARSGPVRVVPVFDVLSEDIAPADWHTLADRVATSFREGAQGVVIAHGTDTLGFTAAALSFLLENLPGPVVLVGAQRSPDRPSSDGPSNLAAAVRVARHPELAEVVVVMHEGLSDDRFAVHRGTRVRKMHSSRRDAFQSRNGPTLATLAEDTLAFHMPFRGRSSKGVRVSGPIDARAALLWFYPGLEPKRAEAMVRDLQGVVLAGTGLGHVSSAHLPWIRAAVDRGTVVAMTTQCLEGGVDPLVYATGRELLRGGVVYLGDLLPETAYVKLLWALGSSTDPARVKERMLEDRAGEFEPRHEPNEAR